MEHQDSDICSGSKSSCLTGGMHLVSGFWEIFRVFFFFFFFPRSLELHLAKRKISGNITTYVLFFVQDARVKYEQINLHHKGQTPFLFHQPPVKWHSNATSSVNPHASKHKPYSFFLINTAKPWKNTYSHINTSGTIVLLRLNSAWAVIKLFSSNSSVPEILLVLAV